MMKPFEPTDQQRTVIESQHPHLMITASAGSGKTGVLVEKFLRLVREGRQPDEILTITFTRKAAAEMKRRIVSRLLESGNSHAAQIAETGPIQTLHGFCERVLRENSVAAGLDPEFEILDGGESRRMLARAVAEALSVGFEDPDDEPVIELIRTLAGRSGGRRGALDSPHQVLIRSVETIVDKFRGSRIGVEELEQMGTSPKALAASWVAAAGSVLPPEVAALWAEPGTTVNQLASACKQAGIQRPNWLMPLDDSVDVAAEHTCALLQLAARTWRRLERDMIRSHRLDFVLLERLAVDLVTSSAEVKLRLAQQYPVVFVDEAQDLNPMQYRLLGSLEGAARMLVGDEQQSIYAFRLADVELFRNHPAETGVAPLALTRNFRSDTGILAFVDTLFGTMWPSYKPMADTDNVHVLAGAPRPSFDGVELWPMEHRDTIGVAMRVRSLVQDVVREGGRAGDICVLVRQSQFGIDLLRRLQRMGVLARLAGGTERYFTRMEVRDVANMLRALVDPGDDFSLLASLRSPFVDLSLDGIVMLAANREAGPNVYHRLRLVPLGVADQAKIEAFGAWFDPLSRSADRMCAADVIAELFAVTPYLERLARRANGPQLLANSRKLLSLAAGRPEEGPVEFAERVRETQGLGHKEGEAPIDDEGADSVQIMTIHKAKGLEFPVVVIPETHGRTAKRFNRDVRVDARVPMVTTAFAGSRSPISLFMEERESLRDLEEEWRVLYVALTRAEHRLCVVIDPRNRPDTFAGAIAKAIGFKADAPPPGVRLREECSPE